VQQAASKRPRTKLEVAEEAVNEDVDDTKAAAKLRRKQKEKHDRAKVEALLDGVVAGDQDLRRQADKEMEERGRRGKKRRNEKLKVDAVTKSEKINLPDGDVYVDPRVDTPELQANLRKAGRRAGSRDTVHVFVVEDVTNPGQRCHWCAVLNGGYLVTPRFFTDGDHQGPIICLKAASSTRWTIHMTDMFRAKHSEIARVLTNVAGWKVIEHFQEYSANYQKKRDKASMALLKRKSEAVALRKHVYDADQFLRFLRHVVRKESKMGVCKR
jgi:hypothetical protein